MSQDALSQDALRAAIGLIHSPSRVKLARSGPLPDGVTLLLRIAAGEEEAEYEASRASGRSRDTVREAATFFVEQILFCPEADSYRVLGTTPDAETGELRRNMALLLRWLHPDLDKRGERSVFIAKVTRAWNDLKTPDRRAAYDVARRSTNGKKSPSRKKRRHRSHSRRYPAGANIWADDEAAGDNIWPIRLMRRALLSLRELARRS